MDKIKRGFFSFFLFGLFTGVIVGMVVINTLVSYRVDNYIREIKYLNSIIEENTAKLEKLNKYKNTKIRVNKIEVNLMFLNPKDKNDITQIYLEENIRKKYNNILGNELESIDSEMLFEVIDNRIMKVEDCEYKLKVKRILASSTVKIWVDVRKKDN